MFAWQDQLALDSGLGLSGQRVGAAIRKCVNARTGEANPSQAWIARALQIDPRNVRRGIADLAERGHLQIVAGHGPRSGNRYRPIVRPDLQWPQPRDFEGNSVLIEEVEKRTHLPSKPKRDRGQTRPEKRTRSAPNEDAKCRLSGQSRPTEPFREPLTEPSSEPAAPPLPVRSAPKETKSKKISVEPRHRADADYLVKAIGVTVAKSYCRRRWPVELAQFESEGLPVDFIVAAAQTVLVEDRLPETGVSSLRYFERLARELKICAVARGESWWLEQQGTLEARLAELSHSTATPPAPSPQPVH